MFQTRGKMDYYLCIITFRIFFFYTSSFKFSAVDIPMLICWKMPSINTGECLECAHKILMRSPLCTLGSSYNNKQQKIVVTWSWACAQLSLTTSIRRIRMMMMIHHCIPGFSPLCCCHVSCPVTVTNRPSLYVTVPEYIETSLNHIWDGIFFSFLCG